MMKLLFKQRLFSWLDSYDIFDEGGETVYTVKGQLAWGHCFRIFDAADNCVGMIKQRIFTWMPQFDMYMGEQLIGSIRREFTLFRPRYHIDCNGWHVEGDFFEWDYRVMAADGRMVATVTKELFNWTDTYSIDVVSPSDALGALMLVLAIDAEKCSRNN